MDCVRSPEKCKRQTLCPARSIWTELNEKYDCIYDRHEAEQRNEALAFWARVFEKVCKLSMLYAVSENPVKPVITVPGVKWAAAFVEHVTDQMLFMVDAYSFENLFDEKCRKAVRYIRQPGGKIGETAVQFFGFLCVRFFPTAASVHVIREQTTEA